MVLKEVILSGPLEICALNGLLAIFFYCGSGAMNHSFFLYISLWEDVVVLKGPSFVLQSCKKRV
jgi:hypothetical protein